MQDAQSVRSTIEAMNTKAPALLRWVCKKWMVMMTVMMVMSYD